MKPKILLSCAPIAFLSGLGLLISAWNGNSSITAAWPISASVVALSGQATGWRAMAGLAGLVLAVILFVWGLISLASSGIRRGRKEAPPELQAGEAKREIPSQ
jgi:hypothetical protein